MTQTRKDRRSLPEMKRAHNFYHFIFALFVDRRTPNPEHMEESEIVRTDLADEISPTSPAATTTTTTSAATVAQQAAATMAAANAAVAAGWYGKTATAAASENMLPFLSLCSRYPAGPWAGLLQQTIKEKQKLASGKEKW